MQILDELIVDHERLYRMLTRFERELTAYVGDHHADLPLLQDIATYYAEYFQRYHHPLEDCLFGHLKRFKPERWEVTKLAGGEHETLHDVTGRLRVLLDQAVSGSILKRSELIECGWQFVSTNRNHIQREEAEPFVQAERYLTVADWRSVGREADKLRERTGLEPGRREYEAVLSSLQI